ncbi:MAG: hypothetical protein JWM47_3819 [Acidimicrobiales bacterium]|nr:hypothetical protein [Acidimicrobiales bacterium]
MRTDSKRLDDVMAAVTAITSHPERGSIDDGLVFDAVRVRLIEIGEALKAPAPGRIASGQHSP